jgi:hypothetical protein
MTGLNMNKSALVVVVTLVAVIAWVIVTYMPGRSTIKDDFAEIASLESDLAQLHTIFLSAGVSAELTENVQAQTAQALSQLIPEDSLEQFVDRFSRALGDFGLTEVTVAPAVEVVLASRKVMVGDQRIAEVLLRTTLIGRYLQIGKAVNYIEKQSFFSEFRRVDLAFDEELNPAVACQLDLTVYLLSDGEL